MNSIKPFLDNDFLLQTNSAIELYHNYASRMPIIDYHCHLNPRDIAENRQFDNITQAWLNGDHYKWRAMRTLGIEEKFITGDASDWEKFKKWAEVVPYTLRNPLYHWTHLELQRYFGITELLSPKTAAMIYEQCNILLAQPEFRVQGLLKKMNIEVVCTTDDPIDSLEYHDKIAQSDCIIKILPAWRPDKAMAIDNADDFFDYMKNLAAVTGIRIKSYANLLQALEIRHAFFHQKGCRLSDHGLDTFYAEVYTDTEIAEIFDKAIFKSALSNLEIKKFKSAMLYNFSVMDWKRAWVQQFHYGVMRNNNTRLLEKLGPDTGFDSIGQYDVAQRMQRFLDKLDRENRLAKTIIYPINPTDNEMIATMIGNFNDGSEAGKMQFGSGWWFLDQKDGMQKQINALSNLGLISQFVGMLTDSRSFLSFPRHEYFRRILCNMFGNDIENGEIPAEMDFVGAMVQDICYNNAKKYFPFGV